MATTEQPMLFQPSEPVSGCQGVKQVSEREGRTEQPVGTVSFDGQLYVYDGYVIEREQLYVPRRIIFTADEAGILPSCELGRVFAMVDALGRFPGTPRRNSDLWETFVPQRGVTYGRPTPSGSRRRLWTFPSVMRWYGFPAALPYVEDVFRQEPGLGACAL